MIDSSRKYFAASNSERGFVSYFRENFRHGRADRVYLIKGGPGTGKSRLLSELATAAEKAGGEVEYYFCSSDPDSLDGIFVKFGNRTVSVLDSTAPHSEDVDVVGAIDNYIDLGAFWDRSRLCEDREEIVKLALRKEKAYTETYHALRAAGALLRASSELVLECTDLDALRADAQAIASHIPQSRRLRSPLCAISIRGRCSFDSFEKNAGLTITLTDSRSYGISFAYLEAIVNSMEGRARVSPTPLMPDRNDAIFSGGVAVVSSKASLCSERSIDVSEFVDRSAFLMLRDRIESLRRQGESALLSGETALAEAGEAHAALERIYIKAMDFEKKEEYSARLCREMSCGDL